MQPNNLLERVYCRPWLMLPQAHSAFADVVKGVVQNGQFPEMIERPEMPDDMYTREKGMIRRIGIAGVISKGVGELGQMLGMYDIDKLEEMLIAAENDMEVGAVVLDINSPGGTVTGVPEIADMIRNMETPVVAYTSDMMASAAYWIASAADAIYAAPSASVGSIGVYSALLDASRYYEQMGLKVELFKSGKYKGMGLEGMPITDEQRELIQAEVDELYDWFASDVLKNRTIDAMYMQGQSLLGKAAVDVNMIDAAGSFEDAINEAEEMI